MMGQTVIFTEQRFPAWGTSREQPGSQIPAFFLRVAIPQKRAYAAAKSTPSPQISGGRLIAEPAYALFVLFSDFLL